MKNFTLFLAITACLLASKLSAQVSFEAKAKAIAEKIENITKDEKAALKAELETVNKDLESGTISKQQADEKKLKLAETRSKNIETRISLAQEELKDLVQQKVDGKLAETTGDKNSFEFHWKSKEKDSIMFEGKKYKITYKTTDSIYIDQIGRAHV